MVSQWSGDLTLYFYCYQGSAVWRSTYKSMFIKRFLFTQLKNMIKKNLLIHFSNCIISVFPLYVPQFSGAYTLPSGDYSWKDMDKCGLKTLVTRMWNILFWDFGKLTAKRGHIASPAHSSLSFAYRKVKWGKEESRKLSIALQHNSFSFAFACKLI